MSDQAEFIQDEDEDIEVNGTMFPDENVSPGVKSTRAYGLKYAKAMFRAADRLGANATFNEEQYVALMELAQGRQSVENIRKMFGHYRDPAESDDDPDGSASLAYIDIQVLNLATKYLNRAIAKVMSNQYDHQLEAIDPVSVHTKKFYEAGIQAFYEHKQWIQEMEMNPKELFPDIDVDVLPEHPDELMFEMLTNPKIKKAVDGELALQLIHTINDFQQVRRSYNRDIAAVGFGHVHCYRDQNGIPRSERINPKFYIGSYSDRENFSDQEYAGFLDFPTVSQFRKEARETMSEEEINEVILNFQSRATSSTYYSDDLNHQDGLQHIPVMRFYFLSEDKQNYITRKNKFGNKTMMKRGLNWKPDADDKYEKIIKNTYTTVYGGTWVVDMDYVYDYGPKGYPRTNLVDVTLPIKSFSPNYYEGRTVSFLSQMIEPLFMINVAWNKIKEILAKGWMGVQEIDFTQLESVALGSGGKAWTPRKVYKHFLQTNRLIKRTPINKHQQQISSSAVDVTNNGLQLADYFTAFSTGISMLEQMIGTAAAESSQQPDRLAVGVAQMSQMAGNLDMEYLFNADEWIYKEVSNQMLLLIQESKRDGIGIEGFIPALGQHFAVPDELAYCDLGLFLKRAPGPEEWAEFYDELRIGLDKGTITHLDSAFIREVKNLKKARHILGLRVKINARKMIEMQQMNNQAAKEANIEATMASHKAAMDEMERQREIDQEARILDAKIQQELMREEKELDAMMSGASDKIKLDIEKRRGITEVIKTETRNQSDQKVARMKAEEQRERDKAKEIAAKTQKKPKK